MITQLLAVLLLTPAADLSPDVLRGLPHVADVSVMSDSDKPVKRIVHVLDLKLVDREAMQVDLKSQGITDSLEERYDAHVASVQRVQAEQRALLAALVAKHDLRHVFVGGISKEDVPKFKGVMEQVDQITANLATLRSLSERAPDNHDLRTAIAESEAAIKAGTMYIGAAGVLAKAKNIAISPAEDAAAFKAAMPAKASGKAPVDSAKLEARQSAIVQKVLAKSDNAVLVLDGTHDLSDNVPDECEYLRVTLRAYEAAVGE